MECLMTVHYAKLKKKVVAKLDAIGTEKTVLNSEVSSFQGVHKLSIGGCLFMEVPFI